MPDRTFESTMIRTQFREPDATTHERLPMHAFQSPEDPMYISISKDSRLSRIGPDIEEGTWRVRVGNIDSTPFRALIRRRGGFYHFIREA
jgi:hypothetical protein